MTEKGKRSAEYTARYGNMPGSSKGSGSRVSYLDCDAKLLCECLDAFVRARGAVLFGLTSDGGVFAVTFFIADAREKRYYHDVGEMIDGLKEWVAYAQKVAKDL